MNEDRSLVYFADPMCSWCWGFSPVIEQVRAAYQGQLGTELVMGGLRAGNTRVLEEELRHYILGHWHQVHEATGQPFDFSFRMPAGFVYDTEPPCRAVVAMREHDPDRQFPFLEALQHAFYVRNRDITDPRVLAGIAAGFAMEPGTFTSLFNQQEVRERTLGDFALTARLGVSGFPALMGRKGTVFVPLSTGYRRFPDLERAIDAWLHEGA